MERARSNNVFCRVNFSWIPKKITKMADKLSKMVFFANWFMTPDVFDKLTGTGWVTKNRKICLRKKLGKKVKYYFPADTRSRCVGV